MIYAISFGLTRLLGAVRSLGGHVKSERGQDLIEYALLSGIIAAAIVGVAFAVWSGALNSMAQGIANCIDFKKSTTCSP